MMDLFEKVEDQIKKIKQGFMLKAFGGREPTEHETITARRISDDFDQLVQADPSQQKKYVSWLCRLYLSGKLKTEDLYKATQYLDVLNRGKVKGVDVNRFKSLPELFDAVEPYLEKLSQGELDNKHRQKIDKETKVIYFGPEGRILSPETKESSQFWGRGTQWCTAADKHCMFSHYNDRGPLYIIMPKDGRKFQFHPETLQLMDEKDDPVRSDGFLETYPWVKEHIKLSPEIIKKIFNSEEGQEFLPWVPPLDDELYYSIIRKSPRMVKFLPGLTPERMNRGIEIAIEAGKQNLADDDYDSLEPYYPAQELDQVLLWGLQSMKKGVPREQRKDFIIPEHLQLEIIKLRPRAIRVYASGTHNIMPSEEVMMAALESDPTTIEYMHNFLAGRQHLYPKMRKFALAKEPETYFQLSRLTDTEKAIALKSSLEQGQTAVFWQITREIEPSKWWSFFDDAIQKGFFKMEELPNELQGTLRVMGRKAGSLGETVETHKVVEKFLNQQPDLDLPPSKKHERKIPWYAAGKEIRNYLTRGGWTFLGSGASASVFEKDNPDLVLKVIHDRDNGFKAFWSLCKRSDNPHLLTVTKFGRFAFPLKSGKYTADVVMMERLEYLGPGWTEEEFVNFVIHSERYLNGRIGKDSPVMKEISRKYPEWILALDAIRPLRSDKIFIDLHSENVMFRGDVPVITDPLTE